MRPEHGSLEHRCAEKVKNERVPFLCHQKIDSFINVGTSIHTLTIISINGPIPLCLIVVVALFVPNGTSQNPVRNTIISEAWLYFFCKIILCIQLAGNCFGSSRQCWAISPAFPSCDLFETCCALKIAFIFVLLQVVEVRSRDVGVAMSLRKFICQGKVYWKSCECKSV